MPQVSIGLFGGTFDPVHNGHVEVVKSYLKSEIVQEVWVIPTYEPPQKNVSNLNPFRTRLEMTRIAFEDIQRVSVSDLEYKLPKPNYSIQTIGEFKKLYPYYNFYWCLGGDQLMNFHTWVLYDALLLMGKLLVAKRPGFDSKGIKSEILDRSEFVDHEPLQISSTEIRNQIKKGDIDSTLIPENVKSYIKKNKIDFGSY